LAQVVETGKHKTSALVSIDEALRTANVEREAIERIVIGLGPGSYTGIRAAIAIAQGWQLARGVKLLGVSSVECLAAQAQEKGIHGRVNIVIDAQRNEFYLATYDVNEDERREAAPLRLVALSEIQSLQKANEIFVGPEVTRWVPAGKILFPDARTLVELATERDDFVPGERLEPIYLRETNFVKAPPPRTF
jgi:tRNA threonylcarbamoyl adenosine modification protein YeaZ